MPPRPRPEPCSSSSLGKDSDEGAPPGEDGEREVQSAYSAAGLDGGLGALEESLPIRRGISKFYNGKSRSYTILKEAIGPSGSAKVIAKADNAYSRKRKNLLAYSIMYDQSQITVPEPETYENRISKRFASLSRLRPSDGMSSNSSSSSSLSSDEIELPQQFNFVQSPDNVAHFASPTITTPLCGSCAPKILPMPSRSFSMVNMHRFHSGCSIICLKEEPEAD